MAVLYILCFEAQILAKMGFQGTRSRCTKIPNCLSKYSK